MASGYIPLPSPEFPRNALLDFSPVSNGLTGLSKGLDNAYTVETNKQVGSALAKGDYKGAAASAYGRGDLQTGLQATDLGQKADDRLKTKFANLAFMALSERDPTKRASMWQRTTDLHPDIKSLDPRYMDPETGPLMLIADAGKSSDWLDYQLKQKTAAIQAAQEGRAQQLFPGQLQTQKLDIESKRRELDSPKTIVEKVKDANGNEILVGYNPRTGKAQPVYGGTPGGASVPENVQRNIYGGLQELNNLPDRYGGDKGSFSSAVGPFQGDEGSIWSNPMGPVARAWGSLTSSTSGTTPNVPPSEVRRAIAGATNTLATVLKPLIRKPGEGSWSDKDQALLTTIVGDLAHANNVQQYRRELGNVRKRINANFGINLPALPGEEPKDNGPRGQEVVTVKSPEEAMALPPGTHFRTPDGRLKVRP